MDRLVRFPVAFSLSLMLFSLMVSTSAAQETELEVGDLAPEFEAPADDGSIWRSVDHVGENLLVLYFYPAAFTGGCTRQACSFRDDRTKLREMGAEVIGVSGDQVEGLHHFRKANRLNFPLLSDTAGHVARAFGVPVGGGVSMTQTVDGEEVSWEREVTTARWTFIIGRDGRIVYKDTEVDAAGDSQAVMAAIASLNGE